MRTPRFTRVSDGKPLRRLLVIAKFEVSVSFVVFAIQPPWLGLRLNRRQRGGEIADGQGTPWKTPCGGCSAIELLPGQGQIGLEPTTRDNPQLRPIKRQADKKAIVEFPGVLPLHHPGLLRGTDLNRHCRGQITHDLRPAKRERRIRNELGVYVLYH